MAKNALIDAFVSALTTASAEGKPLPVFKEFSTQWEARIKAEQAAKEAEKANRVVEAQRIAGAITDTETVALAEMGFITQQHMPTHGKNKNTPNLYLVNKTVAHNTGFLLLSKVNIMKSINDLTKVVKALEILKTVADKV